MLATGKGLSLSGSNGSFEVLNDVMMIRNHLLSPILEHEQSKIIFPNTKGCFIIERFLM